MYWEGGGPCQQGMLEQVETLTSLLTPHWGLPDSPKRPIDCEERMCTRGPRTKFKATGNSFFEATWISFLNSHPYSVLLQNVAMLVFM